MRKQLQETQDRTRKRIKEDLKESGLAYTEYAENVLPKLKAKYVKKFAEAEVTPFLCAILFPAPISRTGTKACSRDVTTPYTTHP